MKTSTYLLSAWRHCTRSKKLALDHFDHLEEFIERQGRPLGEFSEQVVEATHQKLDKIWQWYCVKNLRSEKHGEQFQNCINDFNSMNI